MDLEDRNHGCINLLPSRRTVLMDGQPVSLGLKAMKLLLALIDRRHRVVSKEELLELVWPDSYVDENNLPVQIGQLRKHFGRQSIITVPGRGYRLIAPITQCADAAALPSTPRAASPAYCARAIPALVGRETELVALEAALCSHRVVTITGAGGAGKTLLARHAALQRRDDCTVVWADLADCGSREAVATALGRALALNEPLQGREFAGEVAACTGPVPCMVVIDGAETAIDLVAELAEELLTRRGVSLLTTSQLPLRLAGENVLRLDGLAVPNEPVPEAEAAAHGAVALFLARAHAGGFNLRWDRASSTMVSELCRRLDGLPLAIELAARRCEQIGLQAVLTGLDNRYQLLTCSARGGPERQRSLRATMQRSHGLLDASGREMLRRLCALPPQFAVQQILDLLPAGADLWHDLDVIEDLVSRSFLWRNAEGSLRLPDNVRRYLIDESAAPACVASAARCAQAKPARPLISVAPPCFARPATYETGV